MTNIDEYMKGKEFFKWNPFFKGYVSDEERKMPIQWSNTDFHFFCKHADLLGAPLEIRVLSNYKFTDYRTKFMRSFMEFLFEWKNDVWAHLNGYSGLDGVNFEFDKNIDINFFNGFRID
jgi:hypothetical protein